MAASAPRLLRRKRSVLLLALALLFLFALSSVLLPPEKAAPPDGDSAAFQAAYDRAYAARGFALREMEKSGIPESAVRQMSYGFLTGEEQVVLVAAQYDQGGQAKPWGCRILAGEDGHMTLLSSGEKQGEALLKALGGAGEAAP